jgi:hypothetical protein
MEEQHYFNLEVERRLQIGSSWYDPVTSYNVGIVTRGYPSESTMQSEAIKAIGKRERIMDEEDGATYRITIKRQDEWPEERWEKFHGESKEEKKEES